MTDLIFPLVDFDWADNAHYETETYLGAECLMSLNGLAVEQGMELYADNVATLAEQRPETDTAAENESKDNALRATEQAWIDTAFTIELDDPATDKPDTPTGDAHLRTLQLLDRDDIRELVARVLVSS